MARSGGRASCPRRRVMGNYAAVDCGTLSTRLLISNPQGQPIIRLTRVTGLGEGVDRSRVIRAEAAERALTVLREYRQLLDRHGVSATRMVGTSALRDAANRASFADAAGEVIGAPLMLLRGDEEAALSFLGATAELRTSDGPWLVADIGGGSTELAVGPAPGLTGATGPSGVISLDLGCVRVTERFFRSDPPTTEELATARQWLEERFSTAETEVPALRSAEALVGLAGTVSALASYDQGLESYDQDAVHHYTLSREAVARALSTLAAQPASRRAGLPGIEPARAPVIVGGTLVLDTLMAHFGFQDCLVSESDILDGLVITLVRLDRAPT
jgi:exopolyphosphatase / guanosine-5'-triphosphate,3'-diphosphate pyrophosphatase